MKRYHYLFVLFSILCISVFCISLLQINEPTVQTSSSVLSNKAIGWGIRRAKNNEKPDLGNSNLKLLQEYGGMAIGNIEDKYVYLTFDNGYEAGYTPKILEVLKNNNVKASFFITAHYLNTNEELVKQMISEGHIVRKSHRQPQIFTIYFR